MTGTTPIDVIMQGDALTRLKEMPSASVDCYITSPIDIYSNIAYNMEYVRRCIFCGPDRWGRVRENQEIGLPNEKCKIWGLQKPTVLPRDINKDGNPGTSSEIENQIRGVVLSGEASGGVSEVVQIEQNSSCLASEQPASDRSGKSDPAVFDCETRESVESHSVGRSEEDEGQEKAKQWGVSQSAVCPGNGGRDGELDGPEQRTQLINKIFCGDALEVLKTFPDNFIDCCICSPPYLGLRDYGVDGQIGLEESPEAYVNKLVEVFREVRRVLKKEGTLWLNLGDSYASGGSGGASDKSTLCNQSGTFIGPRPSQIELRRSVITRKPTGDLKPKDLIGTPWMVAFALRADGWYLRSDIIWCLSGGAKVYARTQKGDMPTSVKDLVRLDPKTVKLWNGEKWTRAVSWRENSHPDDPIELTLRSGERIGCTPDHVWPTQRGDVKTDDLVIGDKILTTTLPEPDMPISPDLIPEDIGWFVGLYLAEGSRSSDCIQIAGHVKEEERRIKLAAIAQRYGATIRVHHSGGMKESINIYSKVLNAIIDTYLGGKTATDKHLSNACWQRSNAFLRSLLEGYLSGDGGYDKANNRWRLGFARNYYLEADLRTLCARLGYHLTIKPGVAKIGDKEYPSFKGEIRFTQSNHHNNKDMGEIVAIGESKGRKFWDIEVEDEPHLFALASGVLTHNCKPNCMPESCKDRPTKSHEYIFLLSKSQKYYYDAEAIKEESTSYNGKASAGWSKDYADAQPAHGGESRWERGPTRNKRTVWTVATKPYSEAHFATFPEKLIEPCVLAGCPEGGICLDPFFGAGTTGLVAKKLGRRFIGIELNPEYISMAQKRIAATPMRLDNWM